MWNTGFPVLNTTNNAIYNSVLKKAGARPADRDRADKRVVSDVKNRAGQTINCVASNGSARCNKNAGGWPTIAVNRRSLTLPANHATITASGYTNLELWLHQLDQQLQGSVQCAELRARGSQLRRQIESPDDDMWANAY